MNSEDLIIKLGRILEQLKFSGAELQEMADNGKTNVDRLGQILEETNTMLEKLSIKKEDINE